MKIRINFSILILLFSTAFYFLHAGNAPISKSSLVSLECDDAQTVIHYDFEGCNSELGSGNISYTEFMPSYPNDIGCTSFEAGNVFRINPLINGHSCVEGTEEGTKGMCVSPIDSCDFVPGDEKTIRFDVTVTPGSSGVSLLSGFEFYEQSPPQFNWIGGSSGFNNYPRYFAVRVLIDNVEIYRQEDIRTSSSWNLNSFDFANNSDFIVYEETVFNLNFKHIVL